MFIANFGAYLLTPLFFFSPFANAQSDSSFMAQANNMTDDWETRIEERVQNWQSWLEDFEQWDWNEDGNEDGAEEAHITDIDPEAGPVGTTVMLEGENFTEESIVRFDKGAIDDVDVSENGTVLTFTVPQWTGRYCEPDRYCTQIAYEVTPGDYRVRVQNDEETSNTVWFEVTESDDDNNGDELDITTIEGPSSLNAGEEGTWTVHVEGAAEGNLEYSVKWGDEGWMPLALLGMDDEESQTSATFTHTYHEEGTYTPQFTVTDSEGDTVTQEAAEVTVGDDGTNEDRPHIDAIDPSSAEAGETVTLTGSGFDEDSEVRIGGNTWAEEVNVESENELTFTVPEGLSERNYNVRVRDDDGLSNRIRLMIVEDTDVEGRISISGISAPTTLEVGEDGTWTVHVDTNLEGNLTYSIDWGDEPMMARLMGEDDSWTQTSATFTHAYLEAGTYEPQFTVTDEEGNSAEVSATVVVEESDDNNDNG